ncbi:Spermatogenesis-associated protein 1, partial [Buceros rhinoceros silvestris]
LVELHVFYVPVEVWNFKLNTVPVALTSKFISAGFIRVSPHITLRVLREKLGEYLGGVTVADKYKFLKCIGKKLAVVKAKQETELEVKSFAPPYALYPELYLLPGVEHFEDVYPLSPSTQQSHYFNAEANRGKGKFNRCNQNGSNGSLFTPSHSNPEDWESGMSDTVLQTSQQDHLGQDQKERNTPKWNNKAEGPSLTLDVNHSDEQGQKLTNMENSDHQKDTKLRRDREQDDGILKMMEAQTGEYVRKNQRNLLNLIIISLENKMVEQLQQMKKDRRHMEKIREELIKKAKGLLEQNKLRRYHVREEWKKKYFEMKKATVSLEDALNKLRQDLELYHQKLLLQLEARDSRKRPNMTNSKNYTIIRITTVQHELEQLRRKLDDTKMKLVIEIKMRKQAATDLRALRAELAQKKINSALILQSRK